MSGIQCKMRECGDGECDAANDGGATEIFSEGLNEDTEKDYESLKLALLNITREVQGAESIDAFCGCNNVDENGSFGNEEKPCRMSTFENTNQDTACSYKTDEEKTESNEVANDATVDLKRENLNAVVGFLGQDLKDISEDLILIDLINNENSSSSCSLSPRAPLAGIDLNDEILEAPEEFRCPDELSADVSEEIDEVDCRVPNLNVCEPEHGHSTLVYRDHDKTNNNNNRTETGDTCGRTVDKDASLVQRESNNKTRDTANKEKEDVWIENKAEVIQQVNSDDGESVKDNDHIGDVVAISDLHVGGCEITTPSKINIQLEIQTSDIMPDFTDSESYETERLLRTSDVDKVVENVAFLRKAIGTDHVSSNVVDVTLYEYNVNDSSRDNRCAEGRDVVNGPGSSVSDEVACVREGNPRTTAAATVKPSIEIGVARCAQAPGCSRVSAAAKVCGALIQERSGPSSSCEKSIETNKQCKCNNNSNESTGESCDTNLINEQPKNNENKEQCGGDGGSCCITSSSNSVKAQGKPINFDSENIEESNSANSNKVIERDASEIDFKEVQDSHLSWDFKNGRLVFDVPADVGKDESERVPDNGLGHSSRIGKPTSTKQVVVPDDEKCHAEDKHAPRLLDVLEKCTEKIEKEIVKSNCSEVEDLNEILCSRNLNRRIDDSRSRLKHLEQKLKEAGIVDEKTESSSTKVCKSNKSESNHDANQNILFNGTDDEDLVDDTFDFDSTGLCEFDVRQINTFTTFNDCDYFVVYDELEDTSEDEECEREHCLLISNYAMRGDGTMGPDGERAKQQQQQHNPDRDNLKSLLKKPGRTKDKKNRVVFNENKNEFFDADYIILIREECDYDDEDDDGVCTCNQHEMVRLTCCEPNCNCNAYDGYSDQTPQSPKFAPPLEFVDAVTLSPPEGYKDMELGEQQLLALQQIARRGQRAAVCRECSASHEDEGDVSQSDNEEGCEPNSDHEEPAEEKEKTDQSQQTTPTTPPADTESPESQRYILETVTMTTVTEQSILREVEDERKTSCPSPSVPPGGSPISGILKGGRLWKQQSLDNNMISKVDPLHTTDSSVTSDEEGNTKRSVRFIESESGTRDVCDGAPDTLADEDNKNTDNNEEKQSDNCNNSVSPESTEMMLTFKLGNHVLISNNSLKPNSAVRQLFPCTKPLTNKLGEEESIHQYLVTAESLRAFEEAKRSKLPQIIQSGDTDDSIKRAIERNTLRRSLIRYEPRSKKNVQKTDNSLVERIKLLTCDVDDINQDTEEIPPRTSPPGEEARNSPEVNNVVNKSQDKTFSPSSSSTTSSNSSVSSTYKKITDLFAKKEKTPDIQNNLINDTVNKTAQTGTAPDLGNGENRPQDFTEPHCPMTKVNSTNDARKQFLSTLAPLTACVSSMGNVDEYYYHMSNNPGERISVASSVGTEYSLEDIDEGLKNDDDESKRIAPDVLAGTPSASESGDELAMFVQQDAGRIERIKKKYQPETNNDEEDEHDDYGFNRRPSVRGIKPRFGSTTEILQQIQNQLQPPTTTAARVGNHVAWPYYSESGLTGIDNSKPRNVNQNMPPYQYPNASEDMKTRNFTQYYRPTTLVEENIYQNCTNQRCARDVVYRGNVNHVYGSPVMRVGGGCNEYYQSLPRNRTNRPQSPPPLEISKNYHQTMVYIPYNHIEGYQPAAMSPGTYYTNDPCHRVSNQNQINKRYLEPVYHGQPRVNPPPHVDDHHYQPNMLPLPPKQMTRNPYSGSQTHLMGSRSESPLPGQFSTARSTQTPSAIMSTCNYYPSNPRYRPMVGPVWHGDGTYVNKVNRHSFPTTGPRYPPPDNISLTDSESQHSVQMPNGFRQSVEISFAAQKDSIPGSPTKPRFIERGVPEGAASVSPQDNTILAQSTSTMTSPTSPQNPQQGNPKPLFYAMNV